MQIALNEEIRRNEKESTDLSSHCNFMIAAAAIAYAFNIILTRDIPTTFTLQFQLVDQALKAMKTVKFPFFWGDVKFESLAFVYVSLSVISLYAVRHYLFSLYVFKKRCNEEPEETFKPHVTIIVPCYQESGVVGRLLDSVVALDYPKNLLQAIFINDGCDCKTGEIIEEYNEKYPWMMSIHRRKAMGKSYALNDALDFATGDVVVFFDADYISHPDFLNEILKPFLDPHVGAVQGYIMVRETQEGLIADIVRLERIAGYRTNQYARGQLGLFPQLGGTAMAVRADVLKSLGGFDGNVLAEDTELTFRVVEAGLEVRYQVSAKSEEEAPKDWTGFFRQRHRWAYGHFQVCFKHLFRFLLSPAPFKKKVDSLFCLAIYFLPVLLLVNYALLPLTIRYPALPLTLNLFYFLFGGFGSPAEAVAGCVVEDKMTMLKALPGLILTYVLNMVIVTKALADLAWNRMRKSRLKWAHTEH